MNILMRWNQALVIKKPCQFELTHQLSPFFPCVGKHRLGQTSEKRGCGHGRRRWEKGAPMYIINCAAIIEAYKFSSQWFWSSISKLILIREWWWSGAIAYLNIRLKFELMGCLIKFGLQLLSPVSPLKRIYNTRILDSPFFRHPNIFKNLVWCWIHGWCHRNYRSFKVTDKSNLKVCSEFYIYIWLHTFTHL